jgi:hypothetical protein
VGPFIGKKPEDKAQLKSSFKESQSTGMLSKPPQNS